MIDCTAVLMAGGRSSRMGQDKAFLQIEGKPLWEYQLEKLSSFAAEVMISGRWEMSDLTATPVVVDRTPGLGPLGGLQSVLAIARHERTLILGVDMPKMSAVFLESLVNEATEDCGIVPMLEGYFEGLAAVYPRRILPVVKEVLAGNDHSMQRLNRIALEHGMMQVRPVSPHEQVLFHNWNSQNDRVRG